MKKTLSQKIAKDSFYNFSTTLISRIGAVVFTIILTRILAPEQFGIYSLVLSMVFLLVMVIDTGINTALLKFVGNGGDRKSSAYFRHILGLKLKFALAASVVVVVLAYPLSKFVFQKEGMVIPLLIGSIYLILLAAESFFTLIFYVFSEVKFVLVKETLSQTLRIALIFLIPLIALKTNYVSASLIALNCSLITVVLFLFFLARKRYPNLFKKEDLSIDKTNVIKFISYVTLGGLSAMFFSYIDILMIGIMVSDASYAGFYRAATTVVFGVAGLLSFGNVLLPRFVKIKNKDLENGLNRILKYILVLSVPASIGLLIIGKYILRVFYGYGYLDANYSMIFLSLLLIETPITATLYALLSAKGKPEIYTKASTMALIANVILNFIFISWFLRYSLSWAIAGAALATLISRLLYLVIMTKKTKDLFKIKLNYGLIIKPLIASLVMAVALIYYINSVSDMDAITGVIAIVIGIAVYFVSILILRGITWEDLKLANPRNLVN